MDDMKRRMGKSLKALREGAGWRTAKAYADHMGMSHPQYYEYESGRGAMTLKAAWAIADDLGVTLDELCGRMPPLDSLPADESRLVEGYRACSPAQKLSVAASVRDAAELSALEAARAQKGEYGDGSEASA